MSSKAKKNTKKSKTNGFDIMYRVVTAALAVAVFPVVYFMNLIYYALDWTGIIKLVENIKNVLGSGSLAEGLQNLINPSAGSTEQTIEITDGYICLAKWDEFQSLINTASRGETNIKDLLLNNANVRPIIISLVLFALVLVLALVILIVAIVGKNKAKLIAILSGIGATLGIASNVVFVTMFANPLVNGDKSLTDIFQIESIMGTILSSAFGKVIELRYDNAFFTVLFLMGAIFIWSLSVMIVNSDDKEAKALREAKKAEKKAKKASKQAKKEAKKAEQAAKKAEEIIKEENKDEKTAE